MPFLINIRLSRLVARRSATPAAPPSAPSPREIRTVMMAHDSGPGPAALATETIEAVRSALEQYVDAPVRGNGLQTVLRNLAKEAHDKSVLPEQLLVVLKDVWFSLPSVRRMSDTGDQVQLLQRVVTMCIKEYYAD